MGGRLCVLVLTYETPSHPGGGGQTRQHSLLESLAERHDVRVLSTGGPPRLGRVPKGVSVEYVPAGSAPGPPPGGWFRKNAAHLLGTEPWLYRQVSHKAAALERAMREAVHETRPHVIQIEHEDLSPLVMAVPDGIPSVLVEHNLFLTVQRQTIASSPLRKRPSAIAELTVVARAERQLFSRASAVVAVTERDERAIRRLQPQARVVLVRNCVDSAYWTRSVERAADPTIIFTASFHYEPNQRAAAELLAVILPAVQSSIPSAQLILVGQRMPDWLIERASSTPGARIAADVDDVRDELHRAWVSVAPMRTGAGSPLKVLESLASGVPVVATPRVSRAIGIGPAGGVLAEEATAKFAEAVASLLRDARLRDALGRAGAELVRRDFDRGVVAEAQERVWRCVVEGGGARARRAAGLRPG